MKVKIYLITDINGLKYVGETKQILKYRLTQHKNSKKNNKNTSSNKLDLENCEIKLLEECEECNSKEREKYWINNNICVNILKLNFSHKKWEDNNRKTNRNRIEYLNDYRQRTRTNQKTYRDYYSSWGGDRRTQNNLLSIDTNLFN